MSHAQTQAPQPRVCVCLCLSYALRKLCCTCVKAIEAPLILHITTFQYTVLHWLLLLELMLGVTFTASMAFLILFQLSHAEDPRDPSSM